MTSRVETPDESPGGILEPLPGWSDGLEGRNYSKEDSAKSQTIEFVLDSKSLWRLAGRLHGVRIECRLGRLWITQEGAPADVILQSGQCFVATNAGVLIVQPVSSSANRTASPAADGDIAFGAAIVPGSMRLRISRPPKTTTRSRIGFDRVESDPMAAWERLASAILCGCGLVGLAYCFKTALGLI